MVLLFGGETGKGDAFQPRCFTMVLITSRTLILYGFLISMVVEFALIRNGRRGTVHLKIIFFTAAVGDIMNF